MLKYVFGLENYDDDEPAMFCAEDQRWDKSTLKELRDKYNVIFKSGGDSIHAIMILNKDDKYPLFVIGTEDDGTIQFERRYGQYRHSFSPCWAGSLIRELKEAMKFCNYKE